MSFFQSFTRPILFKLSAESAHNVGIKTLQTTLSSKFAQDFAARHLEANLFDNLERFGLNFKNPIGVAAGFDKNGIAVDQLAALGFGFVEVGTVTYKPQTGNPKPRLFRLPGDQALINRLGFNNDGAIAVTARLANLKRRCVVGVNIGKNKDVPNEEAAANYLKSFDLIYPAADYVAVNISSPNTPHLRELQKAENLESLLSSLQQRNAFLTKGVGLQNIRRGHPESETHNDLTRDKKPLLLKIAPDLNESDIESIVDIALRYEVAGIIATNTTTSRAGIKKSDIANFGAGGLSGKPLAQLSTDVISMIFRYSKGKLPIIGVGGIFSAADAFEKIAAGAALIQAYTGFVYGGPTFARDVNIGLAAIIKERGFAAIEDAVGSGVKM